MSPDHPLTPLLRELCPKRYPKGNVASAEPALDPIELYELACRLGARGVVVLPPDHPLRTGEPNKEMLREMHSGFEAATMLQYPPHPPLEAALRAALAVLREAL